MNFEMIRNQKLEISAPLAAPTACPWLTHTGASEHNYNYYHYHHYRDHYHHYRDNYHEHYHPHDHRHDHRLTHTD